MRGQARAAMVSREELEAALIAEVVERGYRGASVAGVCGRAGTDRQGFEEHFADLEDGYCEMIEALTRGLFELAMPAFLSGAPWRERIRAVAYTMFDYIDKDRVRGHFLFVDVLDAPERAQAIRDQGTKAFNWFIDQGRSELADPDSVSVATAEAVGGSVYYQVRRAIEEDLEASELVPKLLYSVVLPYVGAEAAAEELEIPPPVPRRGED